jgi:hypothetical protein
VARCELAIVINIGARRCSVRIHVGVGQRCRALDVESPARRGCSVRIHVGVGQRCRAVDVESPARRGCSVRIHVGVGQRCRAVDVESPALPAASARSATIGAPMEEMSGKVQNASTHMLRRQSNEHVHNSRSVQVPVQGRDG